jgi:uncharacterized protein YxjI
VATLTPEPVAAISRQTTAARRHSSPVLRARDVACGAAILCCSGQAQNGAFTGDAVLELQDFLVKEQVAMFKTTDTYDIFDPRTGQQVGVAREVPGRFVTLMRWLVSKKLMPTRIEVREHPEEALVFTIRKPVSLFRQHIEVYDAQDEPIGHFVSKIFSLGGGFHVYDHNDKPFAELQGKWTGWEFTFRTPEGHEMGRVTKKWAGMLKELFTSADNYVVSIADDLADQPIAKMLLLAATLAIDIVYYEEGK